MPKSITVSEVMTRNVIAVRPDVPARAIAALLFRHRISAVPVVDEEGAPIGIVSEGDLIPRQETEREQRRDWWLRMLAEGEELDPAFVAEIEGRQRTARELMSGPVVTVPHTADPQAVADVLRAHRIKRVPVMRDGRMVGIVSRADLVGWLAQPSEAGAASAADAAEAGDGAARHADAGVRTHQPAGSAFQNLVHRVLEDKVSAQDHDAALPWETRHHDVHELLATKLTGEAWRRMLRRAHLAHDRGEREYMLLRFPSALCTDRGRAINAADPDWPETLRGLPSQIFTRWQTELRPIGFDLSARIVDFPGGLPGDAGLFLAWHA